MTTFSMTTTTFEVTFQGGPLGLSLAPEYAEEAGEEDGFVAVEKASPASESVVDFLLPAANSPFSEEGGGNATGLPFTHPSETHNNNVGAAETSERKKRLARVWVLRVNPGSQADKTKAIMQDDEVIRIADIDVKEYGDYDAFIDRIRAGPRPLKLTFRRAREPKQAPRPGSASSWEAVENSRTVESEDALREVRRSVRYRALEERQRATYWKLFLNYLPSDETKRDEVSERNRRCYEEFLSHEITPGSQLTRPRRLVGQAWWENNLPRDEATKREESSGRDDQDFKKKEEEEENNTVTTGIHEAGEEEDTPDAMLDEDIWKDVLRTHPGMNFFVQNANYERMRRILFVYAKLNPQVRYVQGMSEVLAPLLYVFGSEKRVAGGHPLQLEADCFFCFMTIMSDFRDLFIKNMDHHQTGLKGQLGAMVALLRAHDAPLADHLQELQIEPQFYALRWFTTVLTREFELPDAVRLWDCILAQEERPLSYFVNYLCVSMLVCQRESLLGGDFPSCLKALQSCGALEVERVIETAYRLKEKDEDRRRRARREEAMRRAAVQELQVVEEKLKGFFQSVNVFASSLVEEVRTSFNQTQLQLQQQQQQRARYQSQQRAAEERPFEGGELSALSRNLSDDGS